jgi:hydrogenase expression/formation protein HypC
MCLGVPARVVHVDGNMAEVRIGEVGYLANIGLLEHVVPGDYIILHAGFGIEKVDPEEAEATIRLVMEIEKGREEDDHDADR